MTEEQRQRYEERSAMYLHMMSTEHNPTVGEYLRTTYHWVALEIAFYKRRRLQRTIVRHCNALNDLKDVLEFRHELKDL